MKRVPEEQLKGLADSLLGQWGECCGKAGEKDSICTACYAVMSLLVEINSYRQAVERTGAQAEKAA